MTYYGLLAETYEFRSDGGTSLERTPDVSGGSGLDGVQDQGIPTRITSRRERLGSVQDLRGHPSGTPGVGEPTGPPFYLVVSTLKWIFSFHDTRKLRSLCLTPHRPQNASGPILLPSTGFCRYPGTRVPSKVNDVRGGYQGRDSRVCAVSNVRPSGVFVKPPSDIKKSHENIGGGVQESSTRVCRPDQPVIGLIRRTGS